MKNKTGKVLKPSIRHGSNPWLFHWFTIVIGTQCLRRVMKTYCVKHLRYWIKLCHIYICESTSRATCFVLTFECLCALEWKQFGIFVNTNKSKKTKTKKHDNFSPTNQKWGENRKNSRVCVWPSVYLLDWLILCEVISDVILLSENLLITSSIYTSQTDVTFSPAFILL